LLTNAWELILKDMIYIYCKWVATWWQWSEAKVLHELKREGDIERQKESCSRRMKLFIHIECLFSSFIQGMDERQTTWWKSKMTTINTVYVWRI
jgi:hypothetical protein